MFESARADTGHTHNQACADDNGPRVRGITLAEGSNGDTGGHAEGHSPTRRAGGNGGRAPLLC